YLWILLLVPFIILTHIFTLRHVKSAALKFSNFEAIERVSKGEFLGKPYGGLFRNKNIFLLFLRVIVYTLIILSVAGITIWYTGEASDFDFILAIDTSTSMLADDFNVSRLEAAKEAATIFVDSVIGKSNIGVISFASTVFVDKEPIYNKGEVKKIIGQLNIKESGGTNIGDTLITAGNLLIRDQSEKNQKSKVIILLTDGQSNTGTSVDTATEYVRMREIIIYTIGMGTEEGGNFFGLDLVSKLDEDTLKDIAEKTNGKYFRAESQQVLENAFKQIALFTVKTISFDISWILLIIGLFLLALEWILVHTVYKTIP
ncbi:MAG: VWA domain-containing protein, partial [Nanoarchaeota archaeon]